MRTTALVLPIFALSFFIPTTFAKSPAPAVPNTATTGGTLSGQVVQGATAAFPSAPDKPQPPRARTRADLMPVRVNIPAIGLNDPIERMGVLRNGELAVPSGSSNYVGWYAAGTIPGQTGSAVFDAHVFAAFKNLDQVRPGDDIYVEQADGAVAHFVVQKTELFKLSSLSPSYLFSRNDTQRLTLITCAGQLTPDHSTYDHRLVVSAVLAK